MLSIAFINERAVDFAPPNSLVSLGKSDAVGKTDCDKVTSH